MDPLACSCCGLSTTLCLGIRAGHLIVHLLSDQLINLVAKSHLSACSLFALSVSGNFTGPVCVTASGAITDSPCKRQSDALAKTHKRLCTLNADLSAVFVRIERSLVARPIPLLPSRAHGPTERGCPQARESRVLMNVPMHGIERIAEFVPHSGDNAECSFCVLSPIATTYCHVEDENKNSCGELQLQRRKRTFDPAGNMQGPTGARL